MTGTLRHANYWSSWLHWDVNSYIAVATQGYSQLHNTAFFLLWPLLLRGATAPFGGSLNAYYIAGLILANLFFYLALVILHGLICEDFDALTARNTLFYLAFSAYAIFFFVGYTEALFLFLSLAVFWSLHHVRYWLAGCCGFLVALTHSQGVVLLVPYVVLLLQRFWPPKSGAIEWGLLLRATLPLILIPTGLATFMLYLGITKHDPLAFSTQEMLFWHRHFTGPLWSIVLTFQAFLLPPNTYNPLMTVIDLIFTLGPLVILTVGWRHLPLHYALFALCMIFFNISYPQGSQEPLNSVPRFMLLVFPVFIILGKWGQHSRVERIVILCFLPMFALNILFYVNHLWIS